MTASDIANLLEQSEILHSRVRVFASGEAGSEESFERLALDIADYQLLGAPGLRRLVEARAVAFGTVQEIPAVTTDSFRLGRVAVHPPELDVVRFATSGTTGPAGIHALRTTETYRQLALHLGAQALGVGAGEPRVVVALAPPPPEPPSSSLGFMMQAFMEEWDGRALAVDPAGASFDARASSRWLAGPGGIDVAGLRRAALVAQQRQEPFLVLATSFALLSMLDALAGARIPAPKRTVVMQTGGFKGQRRTVEPRQLRAAVARAFKIPRSQVVGEYGMTELASQLYEGTLEYGGLRGPAQVYLEPPWLRVTAVHPATLAPVPDGEVGLARIVDLANVDSAVAVLTQDLVRRRDGGVDLLGRRPRVVPRGCSLSSEALLFGGGQ